MKKAIVITHKELGRAFLDVIQNIAGHTEALDFISNENLDINGLITAIQKRMDITADATFYLLVELKGGSPYLAARKIAMQNRNVYVFSGLNLPMILSFIMKKDMFSAAELAEVMIRDAHRGVTFFQKDLGEKL
jgi:PTS system sorbose-specific IIA component